MKTSETNIVFESTDREYWLKKISSIYEDFSKQEGNNRVILSFENSIHKSDMKPFHLVTLACLIHYFDQNGFVVGLSQTNKELHDYIYNELEFYEYWKGEKNHVETLSDDSIFNLWRIVDSEKDLYAKHVEEYFKRNHFKDRDLSAISVGLVEAYYNVFDHAEAGGNAFSLIQYDENKSILHVAISDFGIGIAQSVRKFDNSVINDRDAILKAIEDNFTTRSTKRNKGLGLNNILSPAFEARVFSHYGFVYKLYAELKGYVTDFKYPGTLLYYDIDLSKMEKEEFLEEFNF